MERNLFFFLLLVLSIANSANAIVINSTISGPVVFSEDVDIVTGGVVEGDFSINGFDITLNILDGQVNGELLLNGFDHVFNLSGGLLTNGIRLNGFNHIFNLSGGVLAGEFFSTGVESVVNIVGTGLQTFGSYATGGILVTGFLADGSEINNLFRADGPGHTLTVTNVAEPGTLVTLCLALLGLGVFRPKRMRCLLLTHPGNT